MFSRSIRAKPFKFSNYVHNDLLFYNRKSLEAISQLPVVFILGGPGSGKSTQSLMLQRWGNRYYLPESSPHFSSRSSEGSEFVHLSTGKLIRDEITKNTSLGKSIENVLKSGKLVSTDITLRLLVSAMNKKTSATCFLIDGFPRTLEQVFQFESMITKCSFVLYYDACEKVLENRLNLRQRIDDNSEAIRTRLSAFRSHSKDIIEFYKHEDRLISINCEKPVNEVFANTLRKIKEMQSSKGNGKENEFFSNVDQDIFDDSHNYSSPNLLF